MCAQTVGYSQDLQAFISSGAQAPIKCPHISMDIGTQKWSLPAVTRESFTIYMHIGHTTLTDNRSHVQVFLQRTVGKYQLIQCSFCLLSYKIWHEKVLQAIQCMNCLKESN